MTWAGQELGSQSLGEAALQFRRYGRWQGHPLMSLVRGWRGRVVASGMGFSEVTLKRWERGNDRTITTLHTATDQIFTAFATHWIPTCWSPAWLATSWPGSPFPARDIISILLTVPSPEAVIKNTLDANSEEPQDTNGGGCDFHSGTWNPEKWFVEARRFLGG